MKNNTVSAYMLRHAYQKGYRVNSQAEVISPSGKIRKLTRKKTGKARNKEYYVFTVKNPTTKQSYPIMVHQLVAYQLFGERVFEYDCIRHKDDNSLNNLFDNILLGTHHENAMDRDPKSRICHATHARSFNVRSDWNEIDSDRSIGFSYSDLVSKYGVSKGTLSYHFNNR